MNRLGGQFDSKPAAVSEGALDDDASAVCLHDVFHDAEPNSYALGLAPQLGAEAIEALEDAFLFAHRNAVPVILNPKMNGGAIWGMFAGGNFPLQPDGNLSIDGGVFDSVIDQVNQGLLER